MRLDPHPPRTPDKPVQEAVRGTAERAWRQTVPIRPRVMQTVCRTVNAAVWRAVDEVVANTMSWAVHEAVQEEVLRGPR